MWQVRHARHDINRLQNDHKQIMKDIEEGLESLHSQAREGVGGVENLIEMAKPGRSNEVLEPFAKVLVVCDGSPAKDAGIVEGDLIAKFGSVDADNFRSLQCISKVKFPLKWFGGFYNVFFV